jgi:two-component system sensor histidine kinase PilS (NtrC family)
VLFLNPPNSDPLRLIRTYINYRLGLGIMLGTMHYTGLSQNVFGSTSPVLFSDVSVIYIIVCFLSLISIRSNRLMPDTAHILTILICDVIALVLMIYASGNLTGGLGYLLLIPMAMGATFINNQAYGLAAFGSLLVLVMTFISIEQGNASHQSLFSAGLTGVSLFVITITVRIFSDRIKISQDYVKKQEQETQYSQRISQHIVETMRTGIIVVDTTLKIQLINRAATILLTKDNQLDNLGDIVFLYEKLLHWKTKNIIPKPMTFDSVDKNMIRASFALLEDRRFPSIIIFIDDTQQLRQEAQKLKLASLGRLTASIAHEIRNPLGAISHASQLLNESGTIDKTDHQLLDIIHNHSQRINFIINSILEFSRKKTTAPEVININDWLQKFRREYLEQHNDAHIDILSKDKGIQTITDPNHLYQIINNLVDNGLRYNQKNTGDKKITLHVRLQEKNQCPIIEVIDNGLGIKEDDVHKIFEPFYTTEVMGSGLGLYLCKELSEANQANLRYSYDTEKQQCVFSLILAHPKRRLIL